MKVARPGRRVLFAAGAAIALTAGVVYSVAAAPLGVGINGLFELDGNAFATTDGATVPEKGDDWSCLFGDSSVAGIPDPNCNSAAPDPVSKSFKTDPAAPFGNAGSDDSLGQGSKDILPISEWHGVIQSVPAKDDLEHAAFATYEDSQGDTVVYFAGDRYSNNGSAFIGVWFFKGKVTRDATSGAYSGSHQTGDTLVVLDNKNGNQQTAGPANIGVYQWDPTCTSAKVAGCADTNLRIVLARGLADCSIASTNPVCGIFNTTAGTPSAWPYADANNKIAANTYDAENFFEGGIDLTDLLQGQDCFTSVQMETRSSESTDAEMKDAVLEQLSTCGTVRIIKDAQPNSTQSFSFAASGLTPTTFSVVDNSGTTGTLAQEYLDVPEGTYSVSENAVSGWNLTSATCDDGSPVTAISVSKGETVTCTFVNKPVPPALHLRKVVVNDNGGTATVADFTLTADGAVANNDVTGTSPVDSTASLMPDTWALSETNLSGYAASAWVCVGGTQNGSNITVGYNQSATCTITNDDIAPSLTLDKIVVNDNGGTAAESAWTLTADGTTTNPQTLSGAGAAGHTDVVSGAGFDAGTYALSESTGPAGYSASSWSCVKNGGAPVTGSSIMLGLADTATCTITNDDIAPALHLRKIVVNDNGGTAVKTDFTLTANGSGANDLSGTDPVDSGAGLKADTFALSETNVTGYSASSWSCVKNGGSAFDGSSVTLGLADTATCTITNDDQPAHITVVKVVNNNHGGTATPNDFSLTLAGNATTSGTAVPVDPGTYTAGETLLDGYTFDGFSGDCDGNGDTTVALGESKTCTLTNSDQQAYITVVKVVHNNNGGSATPNDFSLTLEGNATTSGTAVPVDPGTYTAGETLLAGYTFNGFSGDCDTKGDTTVALGESKTCTLTNSDKPPKLHLRKIVVNDNGGTATDQDWTLTANGTGSNDLSGTTPVDSGAGINIDTWTLSESTGPAGYTASAWSCVKNGGDPVTGSSITLGLGDEATCTITNDDQPGTIIIKKVIKPTGSSTSFSFDADGTGYNDFSLAGGQQNSQTLNAGSYSVKELVPLGWVLTGIGGSSDPNTPYSCTVSGSGGSSGVGDLNTQTASVSLKNGDTVTCVFENTGEGVTRTQGFWATHPQLANIAWFGGTAFGHTFPGVAATAGIGDVTLCGRPIDTLDKLMGGFWSDISKTSTGVKRSSLDQARMQLLQQMLAAELNASAFGSQPGSGSFAAWESAYCGNSQSAIKTAQQQAASFNTAGDSAAFTPGTSADSKAARAIADKAFWNVLP